MLVNKYSYIGSTYHLTMELRAKKAIVTCNIAISYIMIIDILIVIMICHFHNYIDTSLHIVIMGIIMLCLHS